MTNDRLDGVWVPVSTPFDGGGVDEGALRALVERLVDAGVDGLVPCGTNGEFASLSDAEHRRVVETVVDEAGDVPVVAGAGETSIERARERVADVTGAGADAVLLPPPYFHSANRQEGVVDFYEAVLDGTDAPLVLYDIPAYTGERLEPAIVAELAGHDRVIGLKDSSGDYGHTLDLIAATPEAFDVLVGADRLVGPGVAAGASGGVNGLANVAPGTLLECYGAGLDGDVSAALSRFRADLGPLSAVTGEHGYVPTVKAALAELGVLPSAAVRPPLVELDDGARRDVADAVAHLEG